jgi:ATP-dependent Clp protease ATP-binding subunit ClpA
MWRTETNTAKTKARAEGEPRRRPSIVLDPSRTGRAAEDLDSRLRRTIVGQERAIDEIVNIYQMHLTGMNPPGRPVGNFLFLGPTGSGKTRIVEATAEALVGNPSAVIKIDCAEFQHSHEIAKLIGSPPGYLGHRETHPLLSQETLNQHHTDNIKISFVLFDEIEKSSDALWNLLLGILDKATLTLGDNRKVDFSRAMIFLTSNLGAKEMSHITAPKLGFGCAPAAAAARPDGLDDKIERTAMEAAKKKFTPEFMNRLDKIVVFQSLGADQLRRIVDLELSQVQKRIFQSSNERPFVFTATESAKRRLLADGTDVRYGARHLKRAIERLVVQPISNLMATDQIQAGDWIEVDCVEGRMTFLREAEGLSVHAMCQMVDDTVAVPLVAAASAMEQARAAARSSRRA